MMGHARIVSKAGIVGEVGIVEENLFTQRVMLRQRKARRELGDNDEMRFDMLDTLDDCMTLQRTERYLGIHGAVFIAFEGLGAHTVKGMVNGK